MTGGEMTCRTLSACRLASSRWTSSPRCCATSRTKGKRRGIAAVREPAARDATAEAERVAAEAAGPEAGSAAVVVVLAVPLPLR